MARFVAILGALLLGAVVFSAPLALAGAGDAARAGTSLGLLENLETAAMLWGLYAACCVSAFLAYVYLVPLGLSRVVAMMAGLATAVVIFTGTLAHADLEARYYALVGTQLLLVIGAVVVISSIFTVLYLVGFGILGRTAIEDRFSIFVSWTLLRSHRVTRTYGTRGWQAWHTLAGRTRGMGLRLLATAGLLVGLGLLLEVTAIWNGIAASVSPTFARTVQYSLYALAFPLCLAGSISALVKRDAFEFPLRLRVRNAVTLPTFISIVGVSIGLWALVVVLSVMHGFESDLRDKILRTNAHIVVEPERAADVVGDHLGLSDRLRAIPDVLEAQAFAHGEVMMASTTNIAVNVIVKGMDPDELAASEQLRGRITPGRAEWLAAPEMMLSDRYRFPIGTRLKTLDGSDVAPSNRRRQPTAVMPGVLLGAELALSLGVEVGGEVQLISPDGDVGPTGLRPKLRNFRVAGLFRTGMYEYDQKMAYVSITDAQRFFGLAS
ncbi:MAG: ABC transporter permease, partial [Myxococcota bacterium]|nr:ABC transporter permease [Myxococcota bacterium]